jgi:hypothetical protein
LPKNKATTSEIPPTHARDAASRSISSFEGLKEALKESFIINQHSLCQALKQYAMA